MMIRDLQKDAHSSIYVGKMDSALFGYEMDVVLSHSDEALPVYAEKCADYFNHLPAPLFDELKRYSLRYYNDMKQFYDDDNPDFPQNVTLENIGDYVKAQCLIVEQPKDAAKIAFSMEFRCAWEPEHGMEWVINDGKVLYVGDYQGVSAWYDPQVYEQECMSYVSEDFTIS